jgi:hypothetical protein
MGWCDQTNETRPLINRNRRKLSIIKDIFASLEDSGAGGVKLTAGAELSPE